MTDYTNIPGHMRESVRGYIELGRPVGDFLTELFSNRLVQAFGRADDRNLACMQQYAEFLYNEAPRGCWGSLEAVQRWQSHNGLQNLADYHDVRNILILPEDTK